MFCVIISKKLPIFHNYFLFLNTKKAVSKSNFNTALKNQLFRFLNQ